MRFRRTEETGGEISKLPDLLIRTLNSLESESMVIIPGEIILFQSDGLSNIGLIRNGKIVSEELLALIRVARRTNEVHRGELDIARGPIGDGKWQAKVTVTNLDEDGTVLVLLSDESESRRIDAVRRDFVANVSHELKTPIGALGLLSEAILGAKDQPAEVLRFATRMQEESRRLTDLVQDIIDLSRIQSSDPLDQAYPVEVEEIIREAVNQAEINSEARGVFVDIASLESATLYGNREQLIAAVHNLVENAINYSPENTRVSISSKRNGDLIEISIVDQGIGIAESDLPRIFERFYRVDAARSRETGGTGLGLSIVKHIAQNHGGDVKVWSKVGVGSTFILLLPISEEENR
jgi:two-component system sensor histidine kinase SenX3